MTEKKRNLIWFLFGIACMTLTVIPNLLLGEDSIFTYHDQLDGEMIAYILQAKHLFSGDILPEFMGGMSKTSLTLPAPAFVVLFLWGDYFTALVAMQFVGRLVGFAGMYLLSREVTENSFIAAAAGVLYGVLPFLSVYGLSQYGIPLLFWCVLQIGRKRHLIFCYSCVALYALTSSLVLVGFALLGMGALMLLWKLWRGRGKKNTRDVMPRFFAAWLLLCGIYIAENFRLLAQMFGIGLDSVSHKAEYVLNAEPFWPALFQNLLNGGQHSEGYQSLFVLALLVALCAGILAFWKIEKKKLPFCGVLQWKGTSKCVKCMGFCVGWNLFFSVAAALWDGSAGVALRSSMGALRAFQLDRLLWITPCLWYLCFACGVTVLWNLWGQCRNVCGRFVTGICVAVTIIAAGITGGRILLAGDVKSNVRKLRNPDYGILSYRDYYAVGVMEQVRDFLAEQTGMGQDAYWIVSLGIDPAAALYHGFYCLDGYSNNYSLSYKHRFRQILEPELEKSDYLRAYFDDWGNRCYLFSSECPGYYTIQKNGFYFQDYDLNIKALQEMGCNYLLSAAYILNADEQGLVLMNETPFETEDSYYCIYVYELGEAHK